MMNFKYITQIHKFFLFKNNIKIFYFIFNNIVF